MAVPYPPEMPPSLVPGNAGVRLQYTPQGMRTQALKADGSVDATLPVIQTPRVSSAILDWCSALGRACWRTHKRGLMVLLYLDFAGRNWRALVPPQKVRPGGVVLPLGQLPAVASTLRLAGSFRVLLPAERDDAWPQTPEIDGIHFLMQLRPDGHDWIARLRVAGLTSAALIEDVVQEEGLDHLSRLTGQLTIADEI